jgi:hypothetical protein
MYPQSSGSNNKPNKKPALNWYQAELAPQFTGLKNEGDIFIRNVG